MINPEMINKVNDIDSDGGQSIIELNNVPYFDKMPYDLLEEKSFKKYMSDLERSVRNSFEYRELIAYLKNTEGMDVCSVLDNVTSRDNTKVKIEIHHSPLTLFDICFAVFRKRQQKKESTNLEAVAQEVMYLHYIGWVGLIPLSSVVHDLVHSQYYFIPTDKVRGNYKAFVDNYYNYIDPDTLDSLDAAEEATKEYNNKQMELFNNHKIYLNIDGSYALPRKDEMTALLKNRVNKIKSGNTIVAKVVK